MVQREPNGVGPFFSIGKKIGEVPGRESLALMSVWTGQTFEV